jgi:Family of unknown function (DUF6152)
MSRAPIPTVMFSLLSVFVLSTSAAHHSRTEFDGDEVELEGVLTDVTWRNPHPTFELRVDQGGNAGESWDVQVFGAVNTLTRAGVDGAMFEAGQRVRLAGRPSTRNPNLILGTHVLLPGNLEAVLGRDFQPRWSGNYVGGVRGWEVDEDVLRAAAAEDRGLFRVWSLPSREEARETWTSHLPFTDAAIAARDVWDDSDNAITRCDEPWLPRAMTQPLGFEIVDNGDSVTFNYVYFGATRDVPITDSLSVDEQPRTPMGFAVGRREGNSLVVETSRITAPAFDTRGSLQTDAMTLTETFTLSDDQSRLTYELEIVDPEVFTDPATYRRTYLALNEPFEPYLCQP